MLGYIFVHFFTGKCLNGGANVLFLRQSLQARGILYLVPDEKGGIFRNEDNEKQKAMERVAGAGYAPVAAACVRARGCGGERREQRRER